MGEVFCKCGTLKQDGACGRCNLKKIKREEQKSVEQGVTDLCGNERIWQMLQQENIGISSLTQLVKDAVAEFMPCELMFQDSKSVEAVVHPYLLATELEELRYTDHNFPRELILVCRRERKERYYFGIPRSRILSPYGDDAGNYYITVNRKNYSRVGSLKRKMEKMTEKVISEAEFGKRYFERYLNAKPKIDEKPQILAPENPLARFVIVPKDLGMRR